MPTTPQKMNLNATSVQVLNTIRANASAQYQHVVPLAENNTNSIRAIGNVLSDYPVMMNEFVSALVNRIALVLVKSRLYQNPWAVFKRGVLEMGETVEEVFINLCDPENYDVEKSEQEVFKRVQSDIKSAFHILNYKKMYKKTINKAQLRQAFLTIEGVTDLITKMIESMYTSANYDEFLVMKYLLAVTMLNGNIHTEQILETTEENMKKNVSTIKGVANNLTFMSKDKTMANVTTHTPIEEQYVILTSEFDAIMDVTVLASAFNMNKAEFLGHRMLVDSFAELDVERLDILLKDEPGYHSLTESELASLKDVQAVIVGEGFFQIYDNLIEFADIRNPQGLYWNYFLHIWKILSVSPFAQAVCFTTELSAVKSVTITPATATASAGQSVQLTATVEVDGLTSKSVNWSATEGATISESGLLTVSTDATKGNTITVTAISKADASKSATATITVA